MKRITAFKKTLAAAIILLILFGACFEIETVEQPVCAISNSSFTAEISIITTDEDGYYYYPYFGIKLPEGWVVEDSIELLDMTFSPLWVDTLATIVYADSLVIKMNSIDPPAEGYYWWVGCGMDSIVYQNQYGTPYRLFPKIHTNDQTGDYYLDYMAGSNAPGLYGGINWARFDSVAISVNDPDSITVTSTANAGPGSLRKAINLLDPCGGTILFDLDPADTIYLSEELVLNHGFQISGPMDNPLVISGNGVCRIFNVSTNAPVKIANMTLTGGSSIYGGAVFIDEDANLVLDDVTIKNNRAYEAGGGIYCSNGSHLTLRGVNIIENAASMGGGIFNDYFTSVNMDEDNRCNLYFNTAGVGNDIYGGGIHIVVDTFTIASPTQYQVYPINLFSFDIQAGKTHIKNSDLFVSPSGENTNSGLTPTEPMRNIDLAASLTGSNHSVRLMEGNYSYSMSGEFFPLALENHSKIFGESSHLVTLDAEGLQGIKTRNHNRIEGITITGGAPGIMIENGNYLQVENVRIINNPGGGIRVIFSAPEFRNLIIEDNNEVEDGGGLFISESNVSLINTLITGNSAERGGGIYCENSGLSLLNTTLTDNTSDNFGGSGLYGFYSNISIANSILFDNYPEEVYIQGIYTPTIIDVAYSTIRGGEEGILGPDETIVNWLEGNMNLYPLFIDDGDHPYSLSDNSPCIDAGNPEFDINLPCWDLLNNKRCWDGDGDGDTIVDMGAYEFGAIAVGQAEEIVDDSRFEMAGFPNPTSSDYHLRINLEIPASVSINIYDTRGVLVKELPEQTFSPGEQVLKVNTRDLNKGIYFCKVQVGKETTTKKIIKVK